MTREEAKELLPIIQAFAEGKNIQYKDDMDRWVDIKNPSFKSFFEYRIKPEIKFRPFKSKEECLEEMQKHHPFGRLKSKNDGRFRFIDEVTWSESYREAIIELSANESLLRGSNSVFEEYTFSDGTPFGIKEE